MSALLDIAALNAWYGASHVLHGVTLRIGEAKCWRWSGATARAARRSPGRSWDSCAARASCVSRAVRSSGMRPFRDRAPRASATCPSSATFFRR